MRDLSVKGHGFLPKLSPPVRIARRCTAECLTPEGAGVMKQSIEESFERLDAQGSDPSARISPSPARRDAAGALDPTDA